MADRIAFLQHSATDVPGVLGDYVAGLGFAVSTHRADHGPASLPVPGSFDVLVVMGSIESVTDAAVTWIAPERRLVGDAVRDGIPVLGVCFGGQLLAEVLGGTVRPGVAARDRMAAPRHRRRGGRPVRPLARLARRRLHLPAGGPGRGPHRRLPPRIRRGTHTGVQFHPEVTRSVVEGWIGDARERAHLSDEDVDALLDGFDPSGRGPTTWPAHWWTPF